MNTTNEYYLNHLQEQVNFLIDACHAYDTGKFVYAKQMSTIIRTLVKDNPRNKQSVSLLKSLGIKYTMKFYNTAFAAINPAILLNFVGTFYHYQSTTHSQGTPIYIPMFDQTNLVDVKWIDFNDWWETNVIVCKDTENNFSLSRKDIILTMAEQDGGAHVDKFDKINEVYRGIMTYTSNILTYVTPTGHIQPIQYLQHAIVRQISHEIIVSLKNMYDIFIPYKPTLEFILKSDKRGKIHPPFMIALNDGDLSVRTDTPISNDRGLGIVAPPGTKYFRLERH